MRRLAIGLVALVLFGPALIAQDDKGKPKPDDPNTPATLYKALVAEVKKLEQETEKIYRAAAQEERRKIVEEYQNKMETYARRFLDLAQKHAKDPTAVDALMMVLNHGTGADHDKAVNLLLTDHIQSEKLALACQLVAEAGSSGAEKLLRAALEKSPHKPVQAQAAFSLALSLKQRADGAGLKPDEAQKLAKESEDLFERVGKQFADVKGGRGQPLAKMAAKELFALRNLAVGKPAPEIDGVDSDNKKFKLSDYRGKVVVLDFWAEW